MKLKIRDVIVFTGFSENDRMNLMEAACIAGLRVSSSVSQKTDVLVCGENPVAQKIERANEMGIPIIRESEFLSMLQTDVAFENSDAACHADFTVWPKELHSDPDQVKRRINGESIKPHDFIVDRTANTATCCGSDPLPYRVTLSDCTCADFSYRGLPCKHIYRLASELGLLDPWPTGTEDGILAAQNMAIADIEKWKGEFEKGNISPQKYTKIVDALSLKK